MDHHVERLHVWYDDRVPHARFQWSENVSMVVEVLAWSPMGRWVVIDHLLAPIGLVGLEVEHMAALVERYCRAYTGTCHWCGGTGTLPVEPGPCICPAGRHVEDRHVEHGLDLLDAYVETYGHLPGEEVAS